MLKKFCIAPLLVCAALLPLGCTARPVVRDDASVRARGRELAMESVAAHGGLDRWRAVGGVTLHLHASGPYYPHDGDYTFDPARNRAVARFAGKHGPVEWRYDGKHGVILDGGRCLAGKKGDFAGGLLSNLLFWFGVPWKLVDDGATQRRVDDSRLLVTYKDVGDTPDDWYLVTLQNEGKRVDHLIYVASGFSRAFEFEASFEDYFAVDGLLVARVRRVRPKNSFWRALAPDISYVAGDVQLHRPLDDAMFAKPRGCRP